MRRLLQQRRLAFMASCALVLAIFGYISLFGSNHLSIVHSLREDSKGETFHHHHGHVRNVLSPHVGILGVLCFHWWRARALGGVSCGDTSCANRVGGAGLLLGLLPQEDSFIQVTRASPSLGS